MVVVQEGSHFLASIVSRLATWILEANSFQLTTVSVIIFFQRMIECPAWHQHTCIYCTVLYGCITISRWLTTWLWHCIEFTFMGCSHSPYNFPLYLEGRLGNLECYSHIVLGVAFKLLFSCKSCSAANLRFVPCDPKWRVLVDTKVASEAIWEHIRSMGEHVPGIPNLSPPLQWNKSVVLATNMEGTSD